MSPVNPLSIASLIDAFVDETNIVKKPTRPTRIMRADALAAVRLRIAFLRASSPVMPRTGGRGAPIARLRGRGHGPAENRHAEKHQQGTGAHHGHRDSDPHDKAHHDRAGDTTRPWDGTSMPRARQ